MYVHHLFLSEIYVNINILNSATFCKSLQSIIVELHILRYFAQFFFLAFFFLSTRVRVSIRLSNVTLTIASRIV